LDTTIYNKILGACCRKKRGEITIGSTSWLGDSVLILPGGEIGIGAVIGAGSVVTRPIPPYAVAVGNPAKVIRMRFPSHCIESLMRISWWDWSVEKIRRNRVFFETDISKLTQEQMHALEGSVVEGDS
jgi:virginiamycin A acetyltransferase